MPLESDSHIGRYSSTYLCIAQAHWEGYMIHKMDLDGVTYFLDSLAAGGTCNNIRRLVEHVRYVYVYAMDRSLTAVIGWPSVILV
jgi:hypothetical protein